MHQNHPHTPGEEIIQGPIEVIFTNSGSAETAGSSFKIDLKKKTVYIPENAKIALRNQRSLEVSLNGIQVHWSTNVINGIMRGKERVF